MEDSSFSDEKEAKRLFHLARARTIVIAFVSVTRLRLRSIRFLPRFAVDFVRTRRQVSTAPGFLSGSLLADRSWTFWTMTAWQSQDAMRHYMTTGDHRTAMPHLLHWCDEASVVHWEQQDDALPSWLEADRRMRDEGRASKVRNPSPRHANLAFRPPRTLLAGPINRKAT